MIHKGKKMKNVVNREMVKKSDLFGMASKMFSCIEKYISPDMKMLDVGTGRGLATRFLASKIKEDPGRGGKVYSIDLSDNLQKMVSEIMEEEGTAQYVEFHIADVEKLSFDDSFFDFILTMNSIHHFTDPINALEHMKIVLKKGGTICIIDWSKKARFLPHKKEDMLDLDDFKKLIENENVIDEYSERYWWFIAIKK
ncbi:MAG: class I SAM-dependent methyltransferase [Candidatus Helarchaeota archaeon]